MQCEEFKKLIGASEGNETELEKHLAECQACDNWLQKELASPPEGLTPAQWQDATNRCFPEIVPEKQTETVADEAPNFWQYFVRGMKYGLVFGLSLVTGFAILEHLQPTARPGAVENVAMVSFIDDSDQELPDFYADDDLDVTFYDASESNFVSFLPKVQIQDFYEIDQEEEAWNENSG